MHQIISTDRAPAAIGPYSQAVRFQGDLIFTAGQIPLDPVSGQLVGKTVAAQTERVLENLSAILTAAGSSLDRVVKTTVFLKNMSDFADMNMVYGRYFASNPPARSTVEVARLPKDVLVEIECLALVA
jgi:2-iminobutanoate/2-iminopropanoate deaminase